MPEVPNPPFSVSFDPPLGSAMRQQPDARRYSRVQLPIPVEVSCTPLRCFRQPAHLRNVSAGGAFLYSPVAPPVGTVMKLDFAVQVTGREVQISCEGPVVRVEPQSQGEQAGVAIEFSKLNLGAW